MPAWLGKAIKQELILVFRSVLDNAAGMQMQQCDSDVSKNDICMINEEENLRCFVFTSIAFSALKSSFIF